MRNARAKLAVFLRITEEINDLLQLLLFLLRACDIVKGDLFVAAAEADIDLTEFRCASPAVIGAQHQEVKHEERQYHEHYAQKRRQIPRDLRVGHIIVLLQDARALLLADQFAEVLPERLGIRQLVLDDLIAVRIGLIQRKPQDAVLQHKGLDLLIGKQLAHLGVADLRRIAPGKERIAQQE